MLLLLWKTWSSKTKPRGDKINYRAIWVSVDQTRTIGDSCLFSLIDWSLFPPKILECSIFWAIHCFKWNQTEQSTLFIVCWQSAHRYRLTPRKKTVHKYGPKQSITARITFQKYPNVSSNQNNPKTPKQLIHRSTPDSSSACEIKGSTSNGPVLGNLVCHSKTEGIF